MTRAFGLVFGTLVLLWMRGKRIRRTKSSAQAKMSRDEKLRLAMALGVVDELRVAASINSRLTYGGNAPTIPADLDVIEDQEWFKGWLKLDGDLLVAVYWLGDQYARSKYRQPGYAHVVLATPSKPTSMMLNPPSCYEEIARVRAFIKNALRRETA